jgi:hypothetical protein
MSELVIAIMHFIEVDIGLNEMPGNKSLNSPSEDPLGV